MSIVTFTERMYNRHCTLIDIKKYVVHVISVGQNIAEYHILNQLHIINDEIRILNS